MLTAPGTSTAPRSTREWRSIDFWYARRLGLGPEDVREAIARGLTPHELAEERERERAHRP